MAGFALQPDGSVHKHAICKYLGTKKLGPDFFYNEQTKRVRLKKEMDAKLEEDRKAREKKEKEQAEKNKKKKKKKENKYSMFDDGSEESQVMGLLHGMRNMPGGYNGHMPGGYNGMDCRRVVSKWDKTKRMNHMQHMQQPGSFYHHALMAQQQQAAQFAQQKANASNSNNPFQIFACNAFQQNKSMMNGKQPDAGPVNPPQEYSYDPTQFMVEDNDLLMECEEEKQVMKKKKKKKVVPSDCDSDSEMDTYHNEDSSSSSDSSDSSDDDSSDDDQPPRKKQKESSVLKSCDKSENEEEDEMDIDNTSPHAHKSRPRPKNNYCLSRDLADLRSKYDRLEMKNQDMEAELDIQEGLYKSLVLQIEDMKKVDSDMMKVVKLRHESEVKRVSLEVMGWKKKFEDAQAVLRAELEARNEREQEINELQQQIMKFKMDSGSDVVVVRKQNDGIINAR